MEAGPSLENLFAKQLALRQRDLLPVVVQHIFDFDRHRIDVDDFVAAIDDIALGGDENVIIFRQKYFLLPAALGGETIELERDRRRRGRSRRNRRLRLLSRYHWRRNRLRDR